jgi:hypothetical protein
MVDRAVATIISGLATLGKPMAEIAAEHHDLIAIFARGNQEEMARELHTHIIVSAHRIGFDVIIARRRHP